MKKAIIIFTFLLLIIVAFFIFNNHKLELIPTKENPTAELNTNQQEKNTATEITATIPGTSSITENATPQFTEEEKKTAEKKVTLLKEILASKNDNDPRIDTELKVLDTATKHFLMQYYSSLPRESLNERGTTVFLIGRNLNTPEDQAFLKNVLSESECLSLANCATQDPNPDPHHQDTDATTMTYPQLMALYSIDKLLSSNPPPEKKKWALDQLQESSKSPIILVQKKAETLLEKYNK